MRALNLTTCILLLAIIAPVCASSTTDEINQMLALTPDIENGRKIYPLCASCHMASGWGKKDGSFPVIAGQLPHVLIKQMADIRARNRENPTMYPFTDPDSIGGIQAMVDVIAYISSLVENPNPGIGDGRLLEIGEVLYQQRCMQCHGDSGQGNNDSFYPRLKGQHFAYILRQIKWIRAGYRKNVNLAMVTEVKQLSDNEMIAVADYLSRL